MHVSLFCRLSPGPISAVLSSASQIITLPVFRVCRSPCVFKASELSLLLKATHFSKPHHNVRAVAFPSGEPLFIAGEGLWQLCSAAR
jgi:hypothetical protein